MRILLRSDASREGGVGHVMRLLALGETLVRRGNDVELRASIGGLDWLRAEAVRVGVPLTDARHAELGELGGADAVVVDSYEIPAADISAAATRVPILAVVDGDTRGIEAALYLDQNLGAEGLSWSAGVSSRMLAGCRYAVIRGVILNARAARAARLTGPGSQILVVLGGTDAVGGAARVVASIERAAPGAAVTAVTASPGPVLAALPGVRVVPPGDQFPALLAAADVVVTAAGTSSWEVCTVGVPAVFVAVVPNQLSSIERIAAYELGPIVDAATDRTALDGVGRHVAHLLADAGARSVIESRMTSLFDGKGAERVAERVELLA